MPVLNVPFRLIFACNPQRGGVLDNNLQPAKDTLQVRGRHDFLRRDRVGSMTSDVQSCCRRCSSPWFESAGCNRQATTTSPSVRRTADARHATRFPARVTVQRCVHAPVRRRTMQGSGARPSSPALDRPDDTVSSSASMRRCGDLERVGLPAMVIAERPAAILSARCRSLGHAPPSPDVFCVRV